MTYTAGSVVNGRHHFNISALARGNYSFSTVGLANNISGQLQKVTGTMGSSFAIQTTDVDIQYEITKQAKYTVTGVNDSGRANEGYWGANEIQITVPSMEHLGTAHMQYEITLEFSNAEGDRKERTYSGNANGSTITLSTPDRLNARDGLRYHGRLEKLVTIKLWRGDVDSISYIERPNFDVIFNSHRRSTDSFYIIETHYGQRDLVFEATGGVDTKQIEFINLPSDAQTAVFLYREQGSSDAWVEKDLNKIGPGYFSIGNRDIPPGRYEYQVRVNGSATAVNSGQDLIIGNGIDGYQSVSTPAVANSDSETIVTPLTTYRRDIYGNAVRTTLHANSATFNSDGSVNVTADASSDQNVYVLFDTHGNMTRLQDGEGNSFLYSYDKRGDLAKEWQWSTVEDNVNVPGNQLFTGTVYRYDGVGQQTEAIQIGETMAIRNAVNGVYNRDYSLITNSSEYNAFGEITRRGTNNGWQEYFDYDNTGRVWRSNSEDGIDKIYLYDVQGNQRQQIISQGRDLSLAAYDYSALATTAGLTTDVMKTSYFYDDLGRMQRQLQASRTQDAVNYQPEHTLVQDRWGNVVQHQDISGLVTEYRYDWRNQQTKRVQLADMNPTHHNYYDAQGNEIGQMDANQNKRVVEYDEANQKVREVAGDGGIQRYTYDHFGNEVEHIRFYGAEGSTPFARTRIYDRAGRLTNEYDPNGGETAYQYDEAGNRISMRRLESIAANGDRRYETTSYQYDNRGNLIQEKRNALIQVYSSSGQLVSSVENSEPITHRYLYDVYGNKAAEQQYTDINTTLNASWQYDYFQQLSSRTDLGGGQYTYTFNQAGQLLQESVQRGTANDSKAYAYYADGLLESLTHGDVTDTYKYNIAGQVIDEYSNSVTDGNIYHNHYDYNALGRLTRFTGSSDSLIFSAVGAYASTSPNGRGYWLNMQYEYDALGNRIHVFGTEGMKPEYSEWSGFPGDPGSVLVSGPAEYDLETIDQWYTFDAENRVLISRGKKVGADIVVDSNPDTKGSIAYSYDKGGNRVQALYYRDSQQINESHFYDAMGNVVATTENGTAQYTSERSYDLMGRVRSYTAYSGPGTASEFRHTSYNQDGLMGQQLIYEADGSGNQGSLIAQQLYNHGNSYDMNGTLKYYTLQTFGPGGTTNSYTYNHQYFDVAVSSTITGSNGGGSNSNTTTHSYDAFGNLLSVSNSSSQFSSQNLSYTLNAAGGVIHKAQGSVDPKHQFYYYYNNRVIGTGGHLEVDFDYSSTPLSEQQGVAQGPNHYVVRAGDTLQGIALAVYGDAQRWYLIADANGLTGDGDLVVGQTLTIPTKAIGLHNSTAAYRNYSASEIIGDTTPRLPAPSIAAPVVYDIKPDKSNPFVVILAIVVAIVVTVVTKGALTDKGWSVVAAAMVGAAAGNIAGQVILIAGGEQDKFNWASLATDVFAAGVGAAIADKMASAKYAAEYDKAIKAGETAAQAQKAAKAAAEAFTALDHISMAVAENIFSQSMTIATGQQEKFSWSSLATSAIMAPISSEFDSGAGKTEGFSKFGARFSASLRKGFLSQGIKLMLEGGGKMDWASIAANAFGEALGSSIVGEMSRSRTIDQMNQVNQSFSELQEGEAEQAYLDTNDQSQIEDFYQARKYIQQEEKGLDAKSLNEAAGVTALMFAAERRQIFDNAMKARLLAETVIVSGQKSSPLVDNGIKTGAVLDSQGVKLEPKNLPSANGYQFQYMTSEKAHIQDMLSGKKAYNDLSSSNKILLKYLMQLDIAIGEHKTQLDALLALSSKITVPKFADVIKEAHAAFTNTTFVYNAEQSPENQIIAAEYRASMNSTSDPAVFVSDLNPKINKKDIKRFLKNPASVSQQAKTVNMNLVQELKFTKGIMEFYKGFEDVYKSGFSADVDGGYFLNIREGREGFRDLIAHEFGHSIVELNTVGPDPKKLLPPRITGSIYNQMDPKIQKIIVNHRRSVLYGRRKIDKTFREGYADVYALTHRAFELNGGKIGLAEKVYDSYFDKVTNYKWTGHRWKKR